MLKRHFQIFIFTILSFACNREKVNLEGRWEILQISTTKSNIDKDSVSQLLPHLTVGNKLDFTGGELTVNRKDTGDSIYYGFASYKVGNDGKTVLIDAGNYKPLTFKLRNAEDGQVELLYKRQDLKVFLREPEEK